MERTQTKKIKIAGAGPSGLTAAIGLAKAGYNVEVFDAREAVGARFIGDFQVLENGSGATDFLEMLNKIGIATNFFVSGVREATLFDHRLVSKTVRSETPFCYLIKRGTSHKKDDKISLDQGLLDQALAADVMVYYGQRVTAHDVDIVATGPTRADGLAKEMCFLTDHPNIVWVLFDKTISPGGYAYLFVHEGEATLGCAITRDLPQINRYFDAALARFLEITPFTIQSKKTGYSFMDFSLKQSAIHDQKLYVGEAGGFQDYLFGLGLRYAIMTGHFAAQSFISSENYDRLWKEAFGNAQEVSLVNRALYESGGNAGLSHFVRQAEGRDFKAYLAKWHAPSFWKSALFPIVKQLWRKETSHTCTHPFLEHWCRDRAARRGTK
ncbi:MAG: NAD(P)/FAD-dependent oxidoreductase [Nitrospirota bacterium]